MRSERAPDVQITLDDILNRLDLAHVINSRIICMRSYDAKARA